MTITWPEEWRVIEGFPDYAASSLGRVKRIRADGRSHKVSGDPLKASLNSSRRYLHVSLSRGGKSKSLRVNRIVCEAFHGPSPSPAHHAAHIDGDALNNRSDNLRWSTGSENEADKRAHGTAAIGERHWSKTQPEKRSRGERHGLAKLTVDDVRRIRADQRGQRKIAEEFGVTQRVIWSVKARKTWGHVE